MQINDPNGRFGRAQSPDSRFSVDDANATIHGGTGYPMCVPRTDPTVTDDPLCPQANRPNLVPVTVNGAVKPAVAGGCLNFSVAGIAPPVSGELSRPVAGQAYCSQFVMKSVAARAATDPDPRQQAPFEVGDSVTFNGTLVPATATAPAYTSAHTIEANIGIYTFPGTQPSYAAIGDFGVGTADPNAVSINGFAVETQDRIFLEAETTDVKTPVDIYMTDVDPVTGAVRNRWATPFAMTGSRTAVPGRRRHPDRWRHHHPADRPPATAGPAPGHQGTGRSAQPADPERPGRRPFALHTAGTAERRLHPPSRDLTKAAATFHHPAHQRSGRLPEQRGPCTPTV